MLCILRLLLDQKKHDLCQTMEEKRLTCGVTRLFLDCIDLLDFIYLYLLYLLFDTSATLALMFENKTLNDMSFFY